ncbi:MAG TPA: LuxR C-terminal-related transcriptional regulator, partial [Acidimicrobiales bacterium]|nr:LuxR C-terminal-related transcriptional regulator [Acidimicrobiales bacterium]
ARVERERNRLVTAEVHLTRGRAIADHYREPTTLLQIETEAALLGLANGTPDAALRRLREWLHVYDTAPISRFHTIAQATEARLLLAVYQPDKAAACLPDQPETDPDCSAVAIHLALLERDPDRAAWILDAWPQLDERRPRLEHELWRAVYLYRQGERVAALTGLDEILPEATADGHVRLFIDNGPLVHDLLRAALPTRREQLAPLINAWGDPAVAQGGGAPDDELTLRELEVLRFLPTRLPARDIAARLYISNNTLKTHLRNIYRKLDVSDRDHVVDKAERLGLA